MAKKVSTKKVEELVEAPVILRPEVDLAIEKRLVALYTLQSVDSEIDKIEQIRGELPQAVQDLEDEIAGLNTRIENFMNDIKETTVVRPQKTTDQPISLTVSMTACFRLPWIRIWWWK